MDDLKIPGICIQVEDQQSSYELKKAKYFFVLSPGLVKLGNFFETPSVFREIIGIKANRIRIKRFTENTQQILIWSYRNTFRAYFFGHLKSAKSSENGRLRREKCQLPKGCEF